MTVIVYLFVSCSATMASFGIAGAKQLVISLM